MWSLAMVSLGNDRLDATWELTFHRMLLAKAFLVDGRLTPLKNMKFSWDDSSHYIMKIKHV